MEAVRAFNNELSSVYESKPPISRAKMSGLTKAALKAIKFYKHVVQSVEKFIHKCRPEYKIPGLYVMDSIVRQSRHQFGADRDVFAPRFTKNIVNTFQNLFKCPPEQRTKIVRVLNLWQKNNVFPSEVIQPLMDLVAEPNSADVINRVQKTIEEATGLAPTLPPMAPKKPDPSPAQTAQATTVTEQPNVAQADVLKAVTQLVQQSQQQSMSLSAQQNQLQQLQLLQQQLMHQSQMLQHGSADGQPIIDGQLLAQIQSLTTQLLNRTEEETVQQGKPETPTQPQQPAPAFNSKLLDFDYGESDEEEGEEDGGGNRRHSGGTAPAAPPAPLPGDVQNLLNNPGMMAHIQQVSATLQQTDELNHQMGGAPPQPSQSDMEIEETYHATAQPLMDMDFEKQEQEYDDRQDHIDVYSSRHGRSRHHRRSRSRDRHHRRSRSRERRSRRSRSRDRHRRSRSRDRERTRERREKDRERRKQGLPPLRDRHVAVCSTQLWIGKLQNRMPESEVHNVLQEFGEVVSLAHVPPRGCAFVTMGSRKQAQQALQKLKGTTVLGAGFKISWSQGPAMNEFRDCWDQEDGTTFIPWHRCPADLKPYLNGAMLDEESLPPHMKTNESAAMGDMEQPLESVASALQPPAGPTPTLPQSSDALPPTMGMTNPPALDRGPPALDRGPPPPNTIMPLPPSSLPAQTHTATVPVGMPVPAMPQGMMPLLPGMNLTPGSLVVQGSPAGVVQGGPAGVIQGGPAGVVQGGPAGVVQGGPAGVVQGGPGPFPLAAASPAPTGPPPNMQHLIFPRRLPLMSPSGAPQPATLPLVSGQQPPIFTPMSEAESSQHGLIQLQPLTSGAITVSSPSLIRAGVGNIRSRFPSPLPTTLRTSTHGSFVARLTQPGLLARPLGMNIAGRPALPLPGQQSFNTPPPNVSAAGPSNNILPQPPTSAPNDWNKKIDDEPVFTDKSANNRWTKIGSDNPQGPPPRGGMDAEQDDDMRPGDSPVGFRFRGPPGPGMFNSGPRGGDMNMGRGSPRFPPGRGMRFGPPMRGGMRQPFMGPPGGGPSGGGPPFSMRGGPPGFRGRGFDRRGGWRGGRMGGDHFFGQEDENAMPTAFNRNRFEREEHDENALPTAFGKKGPFEQDDNSALPTPFGKKGHFEQKDENSLPTSFGKRNQFEQEENAVPTSFGKKSWNHREDETALPTTFGKKRFGDEDFDENGLPTSFGNKRYNRRDEHGGGDEGYNKRRRYDEYDDRRDRHNERDGRYDRDNDRRDRRDDRRDRDRKTDRDRWSDDRDKDHKDENLDRDRRERDRRDENKEDRNSKERKDEKNEGEKKRDRVRKSRWTDNTDIVVPSTVSVPGTSGSSSTPQPDANVTLEDGEVRDEDEKVTRTKADDSVAQSKANNDVHATDNAEIDAQPSTHQATVESEQKEANSLAKHTELPINATTSDLKQDSTNVCDNPASAQGSASNNPVANAHDVPDAGFQQSSDEPMLLMEKSQQHAEQHDQQPAAGHDESEAQAMVTHHSRSPVEPQHNKVACSDQFDATAGAEPAIAGGELAIAGGESAIAGGESAIAGSESAIAGGEPVMQEAVDSQPTTSVDNLPFNAGFEGCVSPAARCEPEISSNRISPNNDFLHVSEPEIISNPVEQQCSSVLASDSIAPMNTEASVDTVPSVHPSQSPPVVGNLGEIEDIDTPMQSTHNSAGSTVMDNVDSGTSSLELPSVPDNAVDTGTSASVESISISPVTEGAVDSSCSASDVAATADSSTVHSEADSTTAPN